MAKGSLQECSDQNTFLIIEANETYSRGGVAEYTKGGIQRIKLDINEEDEADVTPRMWT